MPTTIKVTAHTPVRRAVPRVAGRVSVPRRGLRAARHTGPAKRKFPAESLVTQTPMFGWRALLTLIAVSALAGRLTHGEIHSPLGEGFDYDLSALRCVFSGAFTAMGGTPSARQALRTLSFAKPVWKPES